MPYSEETLYAEWGPEAAALRDEATQQMVDAIAARVARASQDARADAEVEEFLARMYAAQR